MTNSEKLLSSFSEDFFYKELVYADLKFVPESGTEIELADLIINLEDVILAIQLKERNEKDRTQDKSIEEKWLKRKCKKAKELTLPPSLGHAKRKAFSFFHDFTAFFSIREPSGYNEKELKDALMDNVQNFLMELNNAILLLAQD